MTRLNADAAAVAPLRSATGATDVTGFGLLGHLGRMALESAVDVDIEAACVPVLDGVRALAEAGFVPGGSARNLKWVEDRLDRGALDDITVTLLGDAQTSGGLVFGVDTDLADRAVDELTATGHTAAVIGAVRAGSGRITLR
jgi:selenide, water dikinase